MNLESLALFLLDRAKTDPADSYTASLLQEGIARIAQKVGEEGLEVALASVMGDKVRIVEESADLLYHLLVLLQATGLTLADVEAELARRHRKS